jgi:hypothetical protein
MVDHIGCPPFFFVSLWEIYKYPIKGHVQVTFSIKLPSRINCLSHGLPVSTITFWEPLTRVIVPAALCRPVKYN